MWFTHLAITTSMAFQACSVPDYALQKTDTTSRTNRTRSPCTTVHGPQERHTWSPVNSRTPYIHPKAHSAILNQPSRLVSSIGHATDPRFKTPPPRSGRLPLWRSVVAQASSWPSGPVPAICIVGEANLRQSPYMTSSEQMCVLRSTVDSLLW